MSYVQCCGALIYKNLMQTEKINTGKLAVIIRNEQLKTVPSPLLVADLRTCLLVLCHHIFTDREET